MLFAHLSDLHFGNPIEPAYIKAFEKDIGDHNIDLLVITGDITDRGRISQFNQAVNFLNVLDIPYICCPGNREIGIGAFWEYLIPHLAMRRFRSFFGQSDRIVHHHKLSNTIFIGLNSVHPFPSWPGRLARETRYWLRDFAMKNTLKKVVFLHHPVVPVPRSSAFWAHTFSDASDLLNICAQTGIHIILQGHKHRTAVMRLEISTSNAEIIVSAAGAPFCSKWDPAYNLIELTGHDILVETREYRSGRFEAVFSGQYTVADTKS